MSVNSYMKSKYVALLLVLSVIFAVPSAYGMVQIYEDIIADNILVKNNLYVDNICTTDGQCYDLKELAIHKSPTKTSKPAITCPFGFDTFIGGKQGICQAESISRFEIPLFVPVPQQAQNELLEYLRAWEVEKHDRLTEEIAELNIKKDARCPEDLTERFGSLCKNTLHDISVRQGQIDALIETALTRQDEGWKPTN